MKFNDASAVDQIAYEMRLADYPRSLDRERINELFNGFPPYTQQEAEENGVAINVNFLEGTRLSHDARMQFNGSFLKPGRFFMCTSDYGAKHKRTERSMVVTKEIARPMKRSSVYYETFRSRFALDVLHGIGPSAWDKRDFWCPDAYGIEDVLVPANTLLTMRNLPFFILYRAYTAPELIRLTRDRSRASRAGWNMSLVDKCLDYIDRETMALSHNNWPEVWSPEKRGERVKGDGGFYASDACPTIDCFDFYYWDDSGHEEGWKRRIILDSWSTPQGSGGAYSMQRDKKKEFGKGDFLFTSRDRSVARSWRQIVSFQFADLSAVAPFHYHTVRGMGYLLYAVCNLQNRMRCKFSESVFEALMMYFRVKSMDEAERALKVELANRGFIDETLQFIPASERYQVNAQLVELGLQENQRIINEDTGSWTQNANRSNDRTEKTKFQVMAEIQAMTAMISAGLQQAYRYQEYEYREIFRRFCLKDSRDPDIITFRANCLRQGVPPAMLTPEAWEIEPERVLGAGNKTLEMAIAEQLMAYRNLYDPEPQRQILRDVTLAITDDPGRTDVLVPMQQQRVTDSVHDAQLAIGTLLRGLPVAIKTGINHIEYVDTMLLSMQVEIGRLNQGGMATQEEIDGLTNVAQHLTQHIALVAQDENEKQRVTAWQKQLSKLMNFVKAFQQRLAQQQKQAAQQGQQGGMDPKDAAKLAAMERQAQIKEENMRLSRAERAATRQVEFEMQMKQKDEQHRMEMEKLRQQYELESQAAAVKHAQDIASEHTKAQIKKKAARSKSSE